MLTLAINPAIWTNLAVVLFLAVCVLMILVVLIQRPQGGGLSGAFGAGGGGSGAGQTAFGTKTGDVLTYATIGVFVVYLLFAVGLNFATRPSTAGANKAPAISTPGAPVPTTDETDQPTDQPADEQADQQPEPPAGTDADQPADQPAETPVGETGGTAPADAPAEDDDTPSVDPASAEQPG